MPTEWIMALGVLLAAGVILCFVVRRYERHEKPWQVDAAEKAAAAEEAKEPPFDIPVYRGAPKNDRESPYTGG